jgi:hypothetical protein
VRDLLRKRATLVQQRSANILSVQNLEARNRGTKISSKEVKHLTGTRIADLYENEDLALALTTTIKVIDTLTEQTRLLERAVLAKARLRPEFKLLLTVWGIGEILGLTIIYEAGEMSRSQIEGRERWAPPPPAFERPGCSEQDRDHAPVPDRADDQVVQVSAHTRLASITARACEWQDRSSRA